MRQDPEAHRTRRRSGCARKRITRRLLVARLRVKIADWRRNRASRPVWPRTRIGRATHAAEAASDVASLLLTVAGRRLDLNGEHLLCLDGSRLAGRLQPSPHLNGRERPRLALCRDSRETGLGEEGSVRAGLFPVGHGQQDHEGQPFRAGAVVSPLDTRRTPLRDLGGIVALEGPSVDGDVRPAVNAFTPDDQVRRRSVRDGPCDRPAPTPEFLRDTAKAPELLAKTVIGRVFLTRSPGVRGTSDQRAAPSSGIIQ